MSKFPPIRFRRALLGALLAISVGAASAQAAWPTKTVRIVVGFAPGGTTDVMARTLAQGLTEALGQPVIVDNKPGASGNIAAGEVIKAAPDGYTVLVAPTSVETANPSLFKSNILPSRDLTPVMAIGRTQMYLVARPGLEVKDTQALIDLAKAQPGKLSYASAGTGTPPQLAGELFKQSTGTFITHVPYRGTGPMLTDLIAGRLDAASIGAAAVLQFVRTGKLRCIATGTPQRIPQLPDVATVAEQGFAGFEMTQWYGLNAPASMPQAAIDKLAAAAAKAVKEPGTQERLAHDAAIAVGSTPAEYARFIDAEQKRWQPVIARAKIKPD
jgi:tripartite-type tricarboxylate transporter receptor subunit TctC